jgi:thiol-disulfide isomerase/thioredoxin
MHVLRGGCWLALLGLLFLLDHGFSPAQAKDANPEVSFNLVKYEEMGDAIRQLQGKVVVVDFWSTTCIPCRREFPHLVELNNKYAARGFAAVSVSLDTEPENRKTQDAVLGFLRDKKATFTNLLLNEPESVWHTKLDNESVPIVFVFNRKGQWVRKYTENVDYSTIEKLVLELLNEK